MAALTSLAHFTFSDDVRVEHYHVTIEPLWLSKTYAAIYTAGLPNITAEVY